MFTTLILLDVKFIMWKFPKLIQVGIYWLNLTISIGGQSIMSDLVKALLHFKGSVPGKDLENGWCKMVIAPRNTLE